MFLRNRIESRVESRVINSPWRKSRASLTWASISETRNRVSERRGYARSQRRGVLLLVVLSMLVLFMLIGTAFLMTSDQSRKSAKELGRKGRLGNNAGNLLDRALLHVVRDTENPNSVIRYQSLLRDLYGTDGFQALVTSATYARQLSNPRDDSLFGATNGQFIDLYITPANFNSGTPNLAHVIKLDRDVLGRPQVQPLSLTRGYYNGGLLTITSGAASGQSARIIDFQFVGDDPAIQQLFPIAVTIPGTNSRKIWRFRVMTFGRADGSALTPISSSPPALPDLAGASFIVNGRPFNGTGVGYNPMAVAGGPRLNAFEAMKFGALPPFYAEIALTPNSVYFVPSDPTPSGPDILGARYFNAATGTYDPLNPKITTGMTAAQIAALVAQWRYPNFAGPGGADESYDAADFQNMFLALLTVTPRAQGRVVQANEPNPLSALDPSLNSQQFLRLDLEDLPIPSFHRPDLVNFWYHRLLVFLTGPPLTMDPNDAVLSILDPYPDGQLRQNLDPRAAALITAIKRRIMLRPIREDHPNFDGGNPASVPSDFPPKLVRDDAESQIAIPYWEAVGPWDVDNDNDGVPDSIWVDHGDPVQELEDGTRYKAIVSYLIIDLDSRLNVNAHGLVDHIQPSLLDPTGNMPGNLAHDINDPNAQLRNFGSNKLAQGLGYGPPEISLRSVFPAPTIPAALGNRSEAAGFAEIDSYAALLGGRVTLDGQAVPGRYGYQPPAVAYPFSAAAPGFNYQYAAPIGPAITGERAVPDLAAQIKFFNYPWAITQLSAFGTPPDLFGRYAIGLDYIGQPVYEVIYDRNAANTTLPRQLLTDSPYEIDLSTAQRRDTWAARRPNGTPLASPAEEFTLSLQQNDDAPFATADLERVLRAWDADAGTLPSRLWDVVDTFDPVKLLEFDPLRVRGTTISALGIANPQQPDLLATAQQMAAISRRLVTTDTYDLPVVSEEFAKKLAFGADGLPGIPGKDDGGIAGVVDDVGELNTVNFANGSDDYAIVMAEVQRRTTAAAFPVNVPTSPRLLDYVRYRVLLQALRTNLIADAVPRTEVEIESLVNAIIHGGRLFAPEVIAGKRMDLNRPFGDGHDSAGDFSDNNGNGVIDEPNEPGDRFVNGVVDDALEAGDPFLDVNDNGKRDGTEPFLNVDGSVASGNPTYTPPRDKLWPQLGPLPGGNGTLAEQIEFDYTNGHGEPIHPSAGPAAAQVRNLEMQGRQLYARNLYCLMLALVDENYIAPWEVVGKESAAAPEVIEPQLKAWIDIKRKELTDSGIGPEQTDIIVKRKLTCRMIAQWAVNCVDMRDADVIMTPFEYDENPWDGWGVPDATAPTPNNIPLDGDSSTDENKGEVIDWRATGASGPKVIAPSKPGQTPVIAALVTASAKPIDHTRGVVWGAERPELLMTETLAFHDRRSEDERNTVASVSNPNGHGTIDQESNPLIIDDDLDQRLIPKGSAFVELYNPWSADGHLPAELYSKLDASTGYTAQRAEGIQLNRLSDLPTTDGKRSPVWRLIVVEEWPRYRNYDEFDNIDDRQIPAPQGSKRGRIDKVTNKALPPEYIDAGKVMEKWRPTKDWPVPPFRPANPDFDSAFNSNVVPKHMSAANSITRFGIETYPYIEREFYFTTDNSPAKKIGTLSFPPDVSDTTFKLRIPDRSVSFPLAVNSLRGKGQTQKFLVQPTPGTDLEIAPIKPGRYAVVGSTGAKYSSAASLANSYTSAIGRNNTSQHNTNDSQFRPEMTRRIELRPNVDPETPQVFAAHFGQRAVSGGVDPNGNQITYQPAIAVPIAGMSVSEPAWGYAMREYDLSQAEFGVYPQWRYVPSAAKGEGAFVTSQGNPAWYDTPFDELSADPTNSSNVFHNELSRTGSTPNYRMVHLQRLANPQFPWNPPPTLPDGKPNPEFDPNLPVNPYRTIDSMSVDLTSFNGVSGREESLNPGRTNARDFKYRAWGARKADFVNNMLNERQMWYFKSLERGIYGLLGLTNPIPDARNSTNNLRLMAQRELYRQEPVVGSFRDLRRDVNQDETARSGQIKRIRDGRRTTMFADEVDPMSTNEIPQAVRDAETIAPQHIDMVLEHTLGYGNETVGDMHASGGSLPNNAIGAPKRFPVVDAQDQPVLDSNGNQVTVDSTYPWMAWHNRPFVSAGELLQVPVASSAEMLKQYTTIGEWTTSNPYDGIGKDAMGNVVPNWERLRRLRSGFGHLANMFSTAIQPADVTRDPATGVPVLDVQGNVQAFGAPQFYRILEFVHVPSRYVGTDTMLTAEVFNDNPLVNDTLDNINGPADPRYNFQPPFNRVSRERDPGRINLNTVTGRRHVDQAGTPRSWSEVFDGIMHRTQDRNLVDSSGNLIQSGHVGPAWRDVVLSRRGYAQEDAIGTSVDKIGNVPDTFQSGLNNSFPTMFANPFRSPDGGDLVPLVQMMQYGVDATMLRVHPRTRNNGIDDEQHDRRWGDYNIDDDGNGLVDDAQEAGFHFDQVSRRGGGGSGAIPEEEFGDADRESVPLFSETAQNPFIDGERNPAFYYQPMSRLGNLVTNRSGVFAIWITVGYFEVEKAPDWNSNEDNVQARFGNDQDLYNRVYPDGYMLGREVGSDTGDTRRHRGFYIVDRTEEVGFKPGEDLNVEKMIRLRRRIE